jgi:hypothetical protein
MKRKKQFDDLPKGFMKEVGGSELARYHVACGRGLEKQGTHVVGPGM